MEKLLIIEDDKVLNLGLQACLSEQGYAVWGLQKSREVLDTLREKAFDLIILDVNLPDEDGFSLCRRIKQLRDVPVVFLTARDEEQDIVQGFDLGADDYITKPFNLNVFQRKVAAILKRCHHREEAGRYCENGFVFDFRRQTAAENGTVLNFTPTELKILAVLIQNRGHVLTKDSLLETLWQAGSDWLDEHVLAVNISRIRGKMGAAGRDMLKTVFGIGYMWSGASHE